MRENRKPILHTRAKTMRKAMTEAEKRLWWHLRHRVTIEGSHFRRQFIEGPYILDFALLSKKLVIEIDGAQHGHEDELAYDARRNAYLHTHGWRIVRFWNHQVLQDMDSVIETIVAAMEGRLD